ncbi:peroxiredoxin [Diaphorobacter aerolatus]|uniref:thioredoxin-dependent peroxiredoxin n=1 Tax=Diaphorobacter aerolatus TaxID=1288495 RepID=A0A7H0GQV5_9BURK|nr:peroxiredoxin [Diaphorobacter aerolatus]QNP50671.1 peroxiredoxin [Diaphorobacter aerolatus]
MSRVYRALATSVLSLGLMAMAEAALKPGDPAPAFKTTAALAGKAFPFDVAAALKKGPVVLYFFPKAFTQGCTLEAHAFAEATPQFNQLGATVVGISHDDIDTLKKFSTEACRDQFAVASDPDAKTIRAYDATNAARPNMADRISYVIGTDGKVVFAHEGSDPEAHVKRTLEAVKKLAGR